MKKSIRLLIENLFDDLYDIDQETNSEIDLADQIYQYEIGNFLYQNKEPYAICCSENTDFQDKYQRFVLFTVDNLKSFYWGKFGKSIKNIKSINQSFCHLQMTKSKIIRFDEKGYENTQIIKNNYDINDFPAFKYCLEFDNDAYLPAIDELQIMYKNMDILNGCISKLEDTYKDNIILYNTHYWSSTQFSGFNLRQRAIFFSAFDKDFGYIYYDKKQLFHHVQPFIKI